MEVDDAVASRQARSRTTRLEQGGRQQQARPETAFGLTLLVWVDRPHDGAPDRLLRQPRRETARGEVDVGAIDRAARLIRIDISQGVVHGGSGKPAAFSQTRQRPSGRDNQDMPSEEWTAIEHVSRYLECADEFPHRLEGESVLLEHIT
jgi:hypothetical protein